MGPRMAGRVKTFIGHVGRGIDIHVSQSGGANDTCSDSSGLLVGMLIGKNMSNPVVIYKKKENQLTAAKVDLVEAKRV